MTAAVDGCRAVIDNTMGASYIGVICAAMLYGVSCIQAWYYFTEYPKDALYIKILVATVWAFDSTHQALISHTVYHYVITNYSNPLALEYMNWSILLEVLFNALIGLVVKSFLTLRIWRLSSRNSGLLCLTSGLVLSEFVCSLVFTVRSMGLRTWAELTQLKGLSMTVNVLALVSDLLIAVTLCAFLCRSRTGFKRSDTMIEKLILFAVSTGMMTSICAMASLISILVWGKTLAYVAFYFVLGRLYSNSLLATLNARQSIRELGENSEDSSFSFQPAFLNTGQRRLHSNRTTSLSIKVETCQHSDSIHDALHELSLSDVGVDRPH